MNGVLNRSYKDCPIAVNVFYGILGRAVDVVVTCSILHGQWHEAGRRVLQVAIEYE